MIRKMERLAGSHAPSDQDVISPEELELIRDEIGKGLENVTEFDLIQERVDFEEVKQLSLDNAEELVELWFPEGEQRGDNFVMRNPHRDDANLGSFSVNVKTGPFADFATDDVRGSNFIDLAAFRFKLRPYAAARGILHQLGKIEDPTAAFPDVKPLGKATTGNRNKMQKAADDEEPGGPFWPVPANAPEPDPKWFYRTTARYEYRGPTGALNFYMRRYDEPDGKRFSPLSCFLMPDGEMRWSKGGPKLNRPLYGLERLGKASGDARVFIVEGEKTADAAQKIFADAVCLTSAFRSNAPPTKTNWTPLKGHDVTIWRDVDDPGLGYQNKVAATLLALGCKVSVVDVEALASLTPDGAQRTPPEKGWDAADALDEWSDTAALRSAVEKLVSP